jgi:glyoxylase-like metal-dependent hydrolase (beta-lactamase superfamily II)
MGANTENPFTNINKTDIPDGWFDVYELPRHVYALAEYGHVQGVSSFLVIGSEKALLWDTGMGISDISKVVQQITELETIVVNSHTHFDHTGDSWRFPRVHIFDDDYAVNVLASGLTHYDLRFDALPELFTKDLPKEFNLETYCIPPVEREHIVPVQHGHSFNLGDRQLEVLHSPGHTHDCIMLYDRQNRLLLTGDAFTDSIFAFMDDRVMPKYGTSDLHDLEKTVNQACKLLPELDYLLPSHGELLLDPEILQTASRALGKINRGETEYRLEDLYGGQRRIYESKGFTVIV